MKYIFKAIEELNKININDEDFKSERNFIIHKLRLLSRMHLGDYPRLLTAKEIEEQEYDYYRYRDKETSRKPIFRRAKNGVIININCNSYIDSIRLALKEGSPRFLKSKDDYYEINGDYYKKSSFLLFNGEIYSREEYEVIDGELIDKTLTGKIDYYDRNRHEYITEKYKLLKKPVDVYSLNSTLISGDTEALIGIYISSGSNSEMLANCFRYKDDMLRQTSSTRSFGNDYVNYNYVYVPIELIENLKFEPCQNIKDAFDKLKQKAKASDDSFGPLALEDYKVKFKIFTISHTKKFRILKAVFEKMGYTKCRNVNAALKMIKDIMEVK